jgi:hypothetical protein
MNVDPTTIFYKIEAADKRRFGRDFVEFEVHKERIIDALRKATGSAIVNEDRAWGALRRAAYRYFLRTKAAHNLRPARRVQRLRDLAKAARRTRRHIQSAMYDDVGFDLLRGWCTDTDTPLIEAITLNDKTVTVPFVEKLERLDAWLSTLEAAATTAARNVRPQPGAPAGDGILSGGDVSALMAVYLQWTGDKPLLTAGPFAQFVELFLIAAGRSADIRNDYVVEFFKILKRKSPRGSRQAFIRPS